MGQRACELYHSCADLRSSPRSASRWGSVRGEAICHFGLGTANRCDVEAILPFGKGRIAKKGVEARKRITVKEERRLNRSLTWCVLAKRDSFLGVQEGRAVL